MEQKYIKEAFETNWVVPLGPNVNGFEKDLEDFVTQKAQKSQKEKSLADNAENAEMGAPRGAGNGHTDGTDDTDKLSLADNAEDAALELCSLATEGTQEITEIPDKRGTMVEHDCTDEKSAGRLAFRRFIDQGVCKTAI